jgi:hypothetical protein
MQGDTVCPEKVAKHFGEGTFEPVLEWVEHELRTSVTVLLPSVQLVVTGQRNTFFKVAVRVGRPANDPALGL